MTADMSLAGSTAWWKCDTGMDRWKRSRPITAFCPIRRTRLSSGSAMVKGRCTGGRLVAEWRLL